MKTFSKPSEAIKWTKERLSNYGYVVKTEKWQGIESPDDMWETMNHSFQFFIPETLDELRKEVRPNLPWADTYPWRPRAVAWPGPPLPARRPTLHPAG